MSDTLYHLQRKYAPNDPTWTQAMQELGLPASYKRAIFRDQFKDTLGMYQLHKSIRSEWFCDLGKLAKYIDAQKRKRA